MERLVQRDMTADTAECCQTCSPHSIRCRLPKGHDGRHETIEGEPWGPPPHTAARNEEPMYDDTIDVTKCPDCDQQGRYEARVLINGRGFYTCPDGHRWQDATEKPSSKGIPIGGRTDE